MKWQQLPLPASKQFLNSDATYREFQRVRLELGAYIGGMYWKKQKEGAYEYLIKTALDNSQTRVGPRNAETEAQYAEFVSQKQALEDRLSALRSVRDEAENANRLQKLGRVHITAVNVLNAIESMRLETHFTVVGTHALFAYEAAAGVRLPAELLATDDLDLIWDVRQAPEIRDALKRSKLSMLRVLQRADASFVRDPKHRETATTDRAFSVDFLRRTPEGDDEQRMCFSTEVDTDIWPIDALRAGELSRANKFEQMVIATTGRMALMRTIHPVVFVEFKRWLAKEVPMRLPIKRRRDAAQAEAVQRMLDHGLLPQS